jgi:hypothetical protein
MKAAKIGLDQERGKRASFYLKMTLLIMVLRWIKIFDFLILAV